jgi:hypothetical protein
MKEQVLGYVVRRIINGLESQKDLWHGIFVKEIVFFPYNY